MREESNEPELAHLPRLRLHFDRRRLGRLRPIDRRYQCYMPRMRCLSRELLSFLSPPPAQLGEVADEAARPMSAGGGDRC